MGNLDFLEKKPSNVIITTTSNELTTLANESADNCLPALSVNTIYSKLGLTTTNVGDKLNTNTNCVVRISSDVDFTPNSDGKVYRENFPGNYIFVETVFNAVNFANGTVYAYTKGNISAADDPAPCIIIPKTFTDSESSAVFEKGVYLGIGIYSGGQTYYTKFEQKIVRVSINISGKGFTSPKKYYSELSNSIDADAYYTLWIDHTVIEAASGKEDDYNAICVPGDWNSKAGIQLDEKLAKLLKAMSYNKVSAIVKYAEAVSKKTPENLGQIKTQQYITAWTVNKNKLNIYYGNDIIFRQTYDVNEHAKWYAKYFSGTP